MGVHESNLAVVQSGYYARF